MIEKSKMVKLIKCLECTNAYYKKASEVEKILHCPFCNKKTKHKEYKKKGIMQIKFGADDFD